jgi:hypothetical protein
LITLTPTSVVPVLGTEPPPTRLIDARYTYDGNGTLVRSIVNGVTTYYPSASRRSGIGFVPN